MPDGATQIESNSSGSAITDEMNAWVHDFTGVDPRGGGNGQGQAVGMSDASAPNGAPGGAASGGPAPNGKAPGDATSKTSASGDEPEPAPAHGLSYEQPAEGGMPDHMEKFDTKNAIPIKSERLAMLDKDLSSAMTGLIDKAFAAAKSMKDLAGKAGIDLKKPTAAVAPLKAAAPKVNESERSKLKNASDTLNAQKDVLNVALISLRDKTAELRRTLDHLMTVPKKVDFDPAAYEAPRDAAQKTVDGVIQFIKFISELINPSSAGLAFLELVGADATKDLLKGGNGDEVVEALAEGFNELKDTTNGLINAVDRVAESQKEQIKDAVTTIISLQKAADTAYQHLVTTQRHFQEALKDITAKIEAGKKGKGGKANPEAQKIMGVYQGVTEASKLRQQAIAAISGAKGLSDLGFWMRNLAPLGELIFDGRDTSKVASRQGSMILSVGTSMMVYQVGGKQVVFYLPQGGLDNSFEELSKWVSRAHELTVKDTDGVEAASNNWTTAIVDGL